MIVTYANQSYDCTKAVREGDKAMLHLSDGGTVEFVGIAEQTWAQFQLQDGNWEVVEPAPSDAERLDALESALLALMGGM